MPLDEQPVLYVADLNGCAHLSTFAPDALRTAFVGALERAGATVVEEVCHAFPGAGVTCVLILAESHAVLHTWPETGTVNVDIFSCTAGLRSLAALEELGRSFGAAEMSVRETLRADGLQARSGAAR